MKTIYFIFSLLLSLNVSAQVIGGGGTGTVTVPGPIPGPIHIIRGSELVITPTWPVYCKETTIKHHINSVYNVHRIDETDEDVTFRFFTQYQRCALGTLIPYQLEGYGSIAEVVSKKLVLFHLNGVPMETQTEITRPDEMQVTVKFHKNRIFKGKGQKSKMFQMVFVPRPMPNLRHYMFWWNVLLVRDASGSYDMQLTQGSNN